jgi:DNA adenine methylase
MEIDYEIGTGIIPASKVSIFGRVGGKVRVRDKIISMFPSNDTWDTYVEVFAGSGAVFRGLDLDTDKKYVINDLNQDIYDIWRDIKKVQPEKIRNFDFKGNKQLFYKLLRDYEPKTIEERLWRNLYLSSHSYSNIRESYANKGSRVGSRLLDNLEEVQEELKYATVTNQDYKKCIKRWDSPKTLFYIDPPYVDKEHLYEGMSVNPYELADLLRNIKGKFILSYNIHPEVKKAFAGFKFKKLGFAYHIWLKKQKETKITNKDEYIITNY